MGVATEYTSSATTTRASTVATTKPIYAGEWIQRRYEFPLTCQKTRFKNDAASQSRRTRKAGGRFERILDETTPKDMPADRAMRSATPARGKSMTCTVHDAGPITAPSTHLQEALTTKTGCALVVEKDSRRVVWMSREAERLLDGRHDVEAGNRSDHPAKWSFLGEPLERLFHPDQVDGRTTRDMIVDTVAERDGSWFETMRRFLAVPIHSDPPPWKSTQTMQEPDSLDKTLYPWLYGCPPTSTTDFVDYHHTFNPIRLYPKRRRSGYCDLNTLGSANDRKRDHPFQGQTSESVQVVLHAYQTLIHVPKSHLAYYHWGICKKEEVSASLLDERRRTTGQMCRQKERKSRAWIHRMRAWMSTELYGQPNRPEHEVSFDQPRFHVMRVSPYGTIMHIEPHREEEQSRALEGGYEAGDTMTFLGWPLSYFREKPLMRFVHRNDTARLCQGFSLLSKMQKCQPNHGGHRTQKSQAGKIVSDKRYCHIEVRFSVGPQNDAYRKIDIVAVQKGKSPLCLIGIRPKSISISPRKLFFSNLGDASLDPSTLSNIPILSTARHFDHRHVPKAKSMFDRTDHLPSRMTSKSWLTSLLRRTVLGRVILPPVDTDTKSMPECQGEKEEVQMKDDPKKDNFKDRAPSLDPNDLYNVEIDFDF